MRSSRTATAKRWGCRARQRAGGSGSGGRAMAATLLLVVVGCGFAQETTGAAAGVRAEAASVGGPAAQEQEPWRAYDGARAMEHARRIVALGPRPLGSEALERTRQYIESELRKLGLQPERDTFEADTPIGPVSMANIIARVPAADGATGGRVIVLAGHYDTKRYEGVRFVGANDGASSTAVLLEAARALVAAPPPVPVWLVFFDGEEAVVRWAGEDNTYGSRHLAERWRKEGTLGRVGALVLFDMIGDADLQILRESGSTPWLTDLIWQAARGIGHGEHFSDQYQSILDDHLPFVDLGVPAVDLIDFSYGPGNRYWHSPFDTIDKLSADSFTAVGQSVLAALPAIAERIR